MGRPKQPPKGVGPKKTQVLPTPKTAPVPNQNRWLAESRIALIFSGLSMLAMLFGGVPGIISLLSFRSSQPKFIFTSYAKGTGELPPDKSVIIISGAISNSGSIPISPFQFDLDVQIEGRWTRFDKTALPDIPFLELTDVYTNTPMIYENPSAKDLSRFMGTIQNGQKIAGNLAFTSRKYTIHALRAEPYPLKLKLTCKDVNGTNYEQYMQIDGKLIEGDGLIPQVGITYGSKLKHSP